MYPLRMGKNIIVSEETVRDLLEAHASLSAWYYELWAALRAGNASPRTPDDATRAAFVEPLATVFPEIASVVRSIQVPRMFVPPPPTYSTAAQAQGANESEQPQAAQTAQAAQAAPAAPAAQAAQVRPVAQTEPSTGAAQAQPSTSGAAAQPGIAPPSFVVPSQVKYEP
jgi:hypothetical protein